MDGDRNAGDIHEQKWPHADFKSLFGGFFNGGNIGDIFFQHPGRFVEKRNEKAVYGKARRILDYDGCFAVKFGCQKRFLQGFFAGFPVGDDLQKPVFGRVIKIMQADEAVGA